ncbi:MAG: hypothetical protein COC15_02465 [Legionellales bacterium]|nr:MAG: hypothetical protein COC15_02465 [Legionellales bacterium]
MLTEKKEIQSKIVEKKLKGHTRSVNALAVLPNNILASGSDDKTIRFWSLQTGKCLRVLNGHNREVVALLVLPNGELVSGGYDVPMRLWSPITGKCLRVFKGFCVNAFTDLSAGMFASVTDDPSIYFWSSSSDTCRRHLFLEGHTVPVFELIVLPNGTLVTASDVLGVHFWSPKTGECLRVLEGHTRVVYSLALLHDGTLVSGSGDETIRFWSPKTGKCLRVLKEHTGSINTLIVLPNGILASGSYDGTIRFWSPMTGKCLRILKHHTDSVISLVVLPDGRLASGSEDRTIKLTPLPELKKHFQTIFMAMNSLIAVKDITGLIMSYYFEKRFCKYYNSLMLPLLSSQLGDHTLKVSPQKRKRGIPDKKYNAAQIVKGEEHLKNVSNEI